MCSVCYKLNVYTFIKDKIYIRRTLNENHEPKRFNIVNKDNLSAITIDFDYCPFCGDDMSFVQSEVKDIYEHFNKPNKIEVTDASNKSKNKDPDDVVLSKVDMSNKSINILRRAGYNTVKSVIDAGPKSLWMLKGIDYKCVDEIIDGFTKLGFDMSKFAYRSNIH